MPQPELRHRLSPVQSHPTVDVGRTAEGRFLEVSAVLGSATNMAEICARVCPTDRLCEGSCILNGVSEPVSIGAIEQFLAEYAFAHGHAEPAGCPPNGRRVAGWPAPAPACSACADELARRGYAVTIFDSCARAGRAAGEWDAGLQGGAFHRPAPH